MLWGRDGRDLVIWNPNIVLINPFPDTFLSVSMYILERYLDCLTCFILKRLFLRLFYCLGYEEGHKGRWRIEYVMSWTNIENETIISPLEEDRDNAIKEMLKGKEMGRQRKQKWFESLVLKLQEKTALFTPTKVFPTPKARLLHFCLKFTWIRGDREILFE